MSVKMMPNIEYNECLKDSPKFRKYLEREEDSIEHLEQKLERTLKFCTGMIDSGKEYVKNQSAFATSLWDLNPHFKENKSAENALNKIIHCFQEMNKFQIILLDQASFIILKNLTALIKTDIKGVKDQRTYFMKASETYDAALTRNAQANKNKPVDVSDAVNQLSASSSCFRHMALDYVSAITALQSKKMHEILSTLLSYYQACNTFYHQGYDLCEDFEEFFKVLSNDIAAMQQESNQLCKTLQNRHSSVQKFSENPSIYGASTTIPNDSDPNLGNSIKTPDKFEGYLFKRTSNRFKTWNRRWFYMNNNQLLYIKREKDETPTIMEEDLKICTVRVYNDSDRRFCFEVISPMKRHTLQADSAEIMHAWITSLHKRINDAILDDRDKVLRSPPLPGAKRFKKINCEQFYKIPGNDKCCDCGSHEPRWASINLGITLCIACSGVHRSLGVHNSKVRSLTLDAWEPEIVKVMMELGNDAINAVFEANYNDKNMHSDNSSSSEHKESQVGGIQRATSNCDNSVRELWIKAKYIDKLFVIPLDEFKNTKISKTFQYEASPLNDIIFNVNGWLVQRPRNNKIQLRNEKPIVADKQQATTDDSASGSEISIESNRAQDDLSFTSDNESTDEDDDDGTVRLTEEEKLEDFNCNLLLYRATIVRNLPVMCYALATGASKNWPNQNDLCRSPLHQAILSNSVTASEFLILNGSKVNAVDENGYSPLHYATQKGFTALAYLLLKHQAKHDIVANDNKQPIDIAIERANADIVTLLRLTQLNEEIGIEDHGNGEGDTYNDVMNDFSRLTASQH